MVDIVLVFMLALVMHQPESDGSGSRRISPRSLLTPRRDRRRTTVAQHSGMQGSDPRGGQGPMVGANPSPMVAVCPPPPPPPHLQQAHPGHYQQEHPHQQQVTSPIFAACTTAEFYNKIFHPRTVTYTCTAETCCVVLTYNGPFWQG